MDFCGVDLFVTFLKVVKPFYFETHACVCVKEKERKRLFANHPMRSSDEWFRFLLKTLLFFLNVFGTVLAPVC